jgi:hypothetical protein
VRRVDQQPERFLARGELSPVENAIDFVATDVLRGDRRVRPDSEEAAILARRHRREQLALPWRQRARRAHHSLGELQQVLRSRRVVGK